MRLPVAIFALLVLTVSAHAQPAGRTVMEPGPKTPQESLKCLQPRPGFAVELLAAEPLVMDPVAFAWGPDGKFWVVEMGDYPLGAGGKNKPGGRVKFLEKTKADGPFDKATVFLDGLGYPTGVTPWGKGVLVTCAPDIFYAEDTDGDGKADKKDVLFTGFAEGNQQHRVNGLVWGLDNWLYGANGDSGGRVKSLKTGQVVDIRGRDFRLKPDTGEFEAVTGQTQFGRARDDANNWFGNNNTNPLYHFVLDDRYLRRNPHLLPPDPRVSVSVKPGAAPVYPLSKPLPRFNTPQGLNHFTSACSAILYRDDLFGPAYVGNSFVSEPVHNLVHREVVRPRGVTFTSQRADDEQKSEFLASSDNWFRPTMIQTGPDGALWVADMYRYVIEHPQWIPEDWQKKLDLRAGHDKGRIYRVFPKDKRPRAMPRLDKLSVKELVACLESPNGWTRDMAQQLLVKLDTKADRQTPIDEVSDRMESKNPLARLHALCVMDGLQHVDERLHRTEMILKAAKDEHPAVRRHAIRVFERSGLDWVGPSAPDWEALAQDPDPQVRLQLAYSLGSPRAQGHGGVLARLLLRDADDRYLLAAGLSSVHQANAKDVLAAMSKRAKVPPALATALLRLGLEFREARAPEDYTQRLLKHYLAASGASDGEQLQRSAEFLDAVGQSKGLLQKLLAAEAKAGGSPADPLRAVYAKARRIAVDRQAAAGERNLAVRLLARGIGDDREDYKLLASLLTPQTPGELQAVALQSLSTGDDLRIVKVVLTPWKTYSPALRAQALDVLLSRPLWTRQLMNALEQREVLPSEVDSVRRQRLVEHKDAAVRQTAAKIFAASSSPDRNQLVSEYQLRMPDKGDPARGAKLFAKTCAACHKLGDVGQPVGPDLAAVGDKTPQGLLVAILDPNRAVEARYVNYQATTKDGRTFTGLLANETGTSITLVGADGKAHSLLRTEIDELSSTGKSVMPEGLEKELPPRDLADLVAFVRAHLPTPRRKTFPGNQPETRRPSPAGDVRLSAKHAAIYGPSLVLEPRYGNLGYWSSPDDYAAWTLELPREATFDVWLDYACLDSSAGNAFALHVGTEKLAGKVAGTGTWDDYRQVRVGQVRLPAGRHEVVLRSQGPVRGALIDLREIRLEPSAKK